MDIDVSVESGIVEAKPDLGQSVQRTSVASPRRHLRPCLRASTLLDEVTQRLSCTCDHDREGL